MTWQPPMYSKETYLALKRQNTKLRSALKTVLAKMPFGACWDRHGSNPKWLRDARQLVREEVAP